MSKNWADRSPVSSTFLQRKVTSHSSYENRHPPNALPSYTAFENANSRAVLEMSHQSGSSEDCYINLRAITGPKPSSPAKHSKNSSGPDQLKNPFGNQQHLFSQTRISHLSNSNHHTSSSFIASLPTQQQLQNQQSIGFVNYGYTHAEEDYENASSFMRPRANTAPSRRRPLVNQNYIDMTSSHFNESPKLSRRATPEVPKPFPATTGLRELSVETSSLPGSPKFVARKGSLPVRLMRQVNAGRHPGGAENQNVDGERAMPFCAACTQIAATLPNGWEVSENEEGIPYFIDHNTRSTHWRIPWLPPCLSCEVIHNGLLDSNANKTMPPPPPIPRRKPIAEEQVTSPTSSLSMPASDANHAIKQQTPQPLFSNYLKSDPPNDYLLHPFSSSNAEVFAPEGINPGSRASTSSYIACYPGQMDQLRHQQEVMRRVPPARPLTRLPNALPLDVAVAEESSKRMVEALKIPSVSPSRLHAMEDSPDGAPTLSSSNPPSAVAVPKRPQHPSVESQLLFMLETQPDFFMETYYKADEKLDRMLDFSVFESNHLEVMRDSLDRKYFEECQAVCASYERYRMALTEQIQKKMTADLKEKHKRQLNHIKRSTKGLIPAGDHRSIDNVSLSSLDFNEN